MKTQNTELRKLAEKYFFEKQPLETHEVYLLKNSKFSGVLSPVEGSLFKELAECTLKELSENSISKADGIQKAVHSKTDKPFHHTNTGDLEGLTDGIKDEFDISVPPDYSHVSVEKLKEFIKNYAEQYINDPDTQYEVHNALKLDNPRAIMGSLYTHLAM